jgi:HSP20 family molecular chaperone IbpA
MALIPHTFLPRSMLDMESWLKPHGHHAHAPNTLDIFDPFDEIDRQIGKNMMWLSKPDEFFAPVKRTHVPKKYRIKLDCRGYNPQSIKTEIKDGKLTVFAREGDNTTKSEHGDFTVKEFRKTYVLPQEVEADKMVSFMTTHGHLIIEMPLKHVEIANRPTETLFPQIVDNVNGTKSVSWRINLPQSIDPTKVHITCKDRDIIVKAENKEEKPDSYSQTFYYQRTTLPEHTDFHALKCIFDDNHHLAISAPLNMELRDHTPKPAITH